MTRFSGINPTRTAISQALRDAHGHWRAALPALSVHLNTTQTSLGRDFFRSVAQDLDVFASHTLRAITMRALESVADPKAALRLARRLVDPCDSPELAARIRRETMIELRTAVYRAVRCEERAWRRRRADARQLTFYFARD